MNLLKSRTKLDRQGCGVVAFWSCRVEGAGGVRSPSCVMGEFPTDYIFGAIREVGEALDALEEPVAGHRAGRRDRVGVGWIRQEDAVNPKASKVGGGG